MAPCLFFAICFLVFSSDLGILRAVFGLSPSVSCLGNRKAVVVIEIGDVLRPIDRRTK